MDRFRKRDNDDKGARVPPRQPLRDPKEEASEGGRRFPFGKRGDDAGGDKSGGRRFPLGGRDDPKGGKPAAGGRLGLPGLGKKDDKPPAPRSGGKDDAKSGGAGRFLPSFGKKDKDDEKPALPSRSPFTTPGSGAGDRPGSGPFGERPARPSSPSDRPGGSLPGARPGALSDRPGTGLPSASGRPSPFGSRDPDDEGSSFLDRGGSLGGASSRPGDRPGSGALPGARPGGLGDRPAGGSLPGARPGGFERPASGGGVGGTGGTGRSPFSPTSDRGPGPAGQSPARDKSTDKQDGGRKPRLPFLGGKDKDKDKDKGRKGDAKPARPTGILDRGGSARPTTALPGAAPRPGERKPPSRPASRSEAPPGRPSTASRARQQAKALPEGSRAPRIVNRGLDLDRKLDLIGVGLVVLGGIMLFGLLPSMSFGLLPPVEGGLTGTMSNFLSQLFGWGKLAWPALCIGVGLWLMLRYFGGQMFEVDYFRVVGALVLYAGVLAWLHMLALVDDPAPTVEAFQPISYNLAVEAGEGGGWFGHQIYFFLLSQFGDWGTVVLLIGWLILGIMLTFDVSVVQLGALVMGAFVTARTRTTRAERRAARQIAQAEAVEVARPGAEALPVGPRQMPLMPASATGTPSGQATSGSGAPKPSVEPSRPRPLIRRRGGEDDETNPSVDLMAPSADGSEDEGQPAPASGPARRLPSFRGRREQAPGEAERSPAEGDEAAQPTGSVRGRFGGFLKRRGTEEAAAGEGEEAPAEVPRRPGLPRPLTGALAGAAALAASRASGPDDAVDDEQAAPADEAPEAEEVAPERSPFEPPRRASAPRLSEGLSRRAVETEAAADLGDDLAEHDEDEAEDEVLPAATPALLLEDDAAPPAAAIAEDDEAPEAGADDDAASRPYRPFSRPLPGPRRPPFQTDRAGVPPRRAEVEQGPSAPSDAEEASPPAADDDPAAAREAQIAARRERIQALRRESRPALASRPTPPAEADDDEAPARPGAEAADEDDGVAQGAGEAGPPARAASLDEPPAALEDPDVDLSPPPDADEATSAEADDEAPAVEEPRARPAFLTGDARPQGLLRRPLPGGAPPAHPPLTARPVTTTPAGDGDEAGNRIPPAGAGLPLSQRIPSRPGLVTPMPPDRAAQRNGEPVDAEDARAARETGAAETTEPDDAPAEASALADVLDVEDVADVDATAPAPDEAVPADEPEETPTAVAPAADDDDEADQVEPDDEEATEPQPVRSAVPEPPRRPLPENRPARPRREEPASVGARATPDLTRRDAVSLGALAAKEEPQPASARAPRRIKWELPDFRDLLKRGNEQRVNDEVLLDKARMIEDTLESFGAPGKVVEVNPGPVITQFGVEPDYIVSRSGKRTRVKVSSIARLDADLALALAARSIRVEAPVPGKGFVGIEVPNDEITAVNLYDVMDSPEFRRINSKLRIALGLSVDGTPVAADLTVMPHLLIAGTTGSGKSVCVNSIIACLLLTNTPEDLQFIMVDPKRVELTGYNGIPHLLSPVVVDLERIVGVLQWIQREMDDRYRKFAALGARNIVDYNSKLGPDERRMPYYVVVIDELADLMMLAPDETEKLLARLAQMARATGIHLIISTQRPSVDVVTGLIKANFPARIAFAVASMMDSRVILDQPGAEKLLGRGDMLYQSPDAPAPLRMQGVFVSDEEINKITRYWKTQGLDLPDGEGINFAKVNGGGSRPVRPGATSVEPGQQQALWDNGSIFDEDDEGGGDGRDEMYDEAVELVKRLNKASISLLQRRLRIGYTRAARLIDIMEQEGIVGPAESGSKPREVLKRD